MPRYLVQASYTPEAVATLVKNPQDRIAGVRTLMQRLGGRLESFDFALGEYDIVAIIDLPDDKTAVAASAAVIAPGHIKTYRTTKLLSGDEMVEALRQAHGQTYSRPSEG